MQHLCFHPSFFLSPERMVLLTVHQQKYCSELFYKHFNKRKMLTSITTVLMYYRSTSKLVRNNKMLDAVRRLKWFYTINMQGQCMYWN